MFQFYYRKLPRQRQKLSHGCICVLLTSQEITCLMRYVIHTIKVKSVTNIRKVSPTSVTNMRSCTYLWYDIKFSWNFKHDDLRKAVLSLLVNDELESDEYVIPMVVLIIKQFENEHEMFDWTKHIFEKVRFSRKA